MSKTNIVKKKIDEINFNLMNPENINKISVAKIITPELYDMDEYPVDGGLMDLRLGAVDPGVRCRTCGGRLKECLGHPGSIELARAVIHLKYVPLIETGLRCFCHECGKLTLADAELEKHSPTERAKKAKDAKECPHCKSTHEKVKLDKPTTFYMGKKRLFPNTIRDILVKIPDDELRKIGFDTESFRPEWAVLTYLLAPPVTVRPSIILESGQRSEDDLTHKLSDIIRANQRLWENLNAGAPEVIIEDLWDLLQYHITTFFDNNVTRIPQARHRSGQPLKTITERIRSKEGRIRNNLAGKRVNYSARTVVSPDPALEFNEIGVPPEIAKIVTVSETINDINTDKVKKLIENGEEYPGANYVVRPDGKRKKIIPELKEEIISEIVPGYKIERHLQNGDIVLFNRHPSLHKASLMAHFVKIIPGRTFRFHPAVVFPYNADYDGDEMNIHGPQTEEARSESRTLLDVKKNLISPKNNTNLLGSSQDSVTGNYLLGLDEFSKEEANQILYRSNIEHQFSKNKVSGKEIFSKVLPRIDFSNDSVTIKNGEIMDGEIDDSTFGTEDGELVKELDKIIGRDETLKTMKKVFDLGRNYLTQKGTTMSVGDLNINKMIEKVSRETIMEADKKTKEIVDSYKNNTLEDIPGKTKEESREIRILQNLNDVRTKISDIVKKEFPKDSPINNMIISGGGGNVLNIVQMSCCVGQQALGSKRIDTGYNERTLPFFKKGDLSPESRGFIKNPLVEGLRPDEYFFQSITGRDSLMDTALRTPKSGYLYRRLASALQDLRKEYDGTVRDGNGHIIQFEYGGDGADVSELHRGGETSPGEAVGMVTAQSLGESSTQMVLNTFHMAGVAEMQVTQGLPRLIEIFDARKKPSSPKMEIYLKKKYNSEKEAKFLAEKIKEIKVEDITSEVKLDFTNKKIEIVVDKESLKRTHLSLKEIKERLSKDNFKVEEKSNNIIIDRPESSFKELYQIKEKLKKTIISGIKGIEQILIVKREQDFVILTLGTNMKKIKEMEEVDFSRTISNDFNEVAEVLGIEAARQLIVDEIQEVLNSQGMDIDIRHLKLIADAMTNTGEVKGVTRMGIIAQKSSILARATFEIPVKQFVNATVKGSRDRLTSVVENIILNQPIPVGTGLPGLTVKVVGPLAKKQK